jgi:hypothetical protein
MARFYLEDNKAMLDAIQAFRGGLIILEDCTKYIDANPHPRVKEFLVDHRMRDLDLFFTFHSVTRVPPFFWEMTHQVLLLKTQDDRKGIERRRIPNMREFLKAFDKVMASKDNYTSALVDTYI